MIELVIVKAGEPARRLTLQGGSYGLGRGETNEIVLDDKEVSRRHARIIVEGETVVVKDLDSGNGTFVGGRAVREAPVAIGGEMEIVPFRIQVKRAGSGERGLWIECIRGAEAGRRYPLAGEALSIGRHADQDIQLDDQGASRSHAMLVCREGVWSVRDNQSANGLLVNDRGVKEAQLASGDVIRIGDTLLRFIDGQADQADLDLLEDSEPHMRPRPGTSQRAGGDTAITPAAMWLFGGLFLVISLLLFLAGVVAR